MRQSTIGRFKEGLHSRELPKTIRAAAELALELALPYIWVDALSIVQDADGLEWEKEPQRMHQIYGHATFTLAAASSAYSDAGILGTEIKPTFFNDHDR